jgi:Na+/proline symporter
MINVLYISLAVFVYIFIGTLFHQVLNRFLGPPDEEVLAYIMTHILWPVSIPIFLIMLLVALLSTLSQEIISFITRGRL